MTTEHKQCVPCMGRGYKGRWRATARGKQWKLETCRACGGAGAVESTRRQAPRRVKA